MAQQQAQASNTYSWEQALALKDAARQANSDELLLAADYMSQLFQANNVSYALMGGLSVRLRGGPRETQDVDIAIGCDMGRLLQIIRVQPRILRPDGPMAGAIRLFVTVEGQRGHIKVQVDLILRGGLGAPDDPATASETSVAVRTPVGDRQFQILNLHTILSSKPGSFYARTELNDLQDIRFLIRKYAAEIYPMAAQLNQAHRQHFLLGYMRQDPRNAAAIELIKRALRVR